MNPTGKGGVKPGEVRNPNGRPKKEREIKYLEVTLNAVTFSDWEKIVQKARDQALKGDAVARKWLADYLVGAPVQRNEHSGAEGGPIVYKVVYDDKPESP